MSENNKELPWWNADGVDAPEDEIPEITEEMLANANFYDGKKLVARRRKGRPVLAKNETKELVSLRISKKTLEKFRATGKGWQTRIDQILTREAKNLMV